MTKAFLTSSKAANLVYLGLAGVAAASLTYKHGLAPGLRMAFALASVLVLFRTTISICMGFLMRRELLSKLDRLLFLIPFAYMAASLVFDWPGLIPVGIIGIVGGLFVGVVCALASPYHRWR